jgi:hypothetical protein
LTLCFRCRIACQCPVLLPVEPCRAPRPSASPTVDPRLENIPERLARATLQCVKQMTEQASIART